MKKTLITTLTVAALIFNYACGDSQPKEEPIVAPEGMIVLDLTKYGKSFVIFVPDTTQSKLEIVEQTYGALDISVGQNFAISITEQHEDLELKKSELKDDEVNKLKGFLVEEPGAILWESEITDSEFHFIINTKIGESDYSIQDLKNTDNKPFDKEAIQKMFDAAKNIKEISKTPNA